MHNLFGTFTGIAASAASISVSIDDVNSAAVETTPEAEELRSARGLIHPAGALRNEISTFLEILRSA